MPADVYTERPLFGGAISTTFPLRFQDVSNIRPVPDHQEVFVDPSRDESLIIELLDLKTEVADEGSAVWFLQDLASEQDAEGAMILEQSGVFTAEGLRFRNMPAVVTTAVGQMGISKGRQGREAQNIVKVYLANLRLKEVATDVLITAYEPVVIKSTNFTNFLIHHGGDMLLLFGSQASTLLFEACPCLPTSLSTISSIACPIVFHISLTLTPFYYLFLSFTRLCGRIESPWKLGCVLILVWVWER